LLPSQCHKNRSAPKLAKKKSWRNAGVPNGENFAPQTLKAVFIYPSLFGSDRYRITVTHFFPPNEAPNLIASDRGSSAPRKPDTCL
jgi:hypothetical protein